MKVLRIAATNFKNIRVVDVQPNEGITKVSGANGAGKTTLLDIIFYGLMPRKTLPPKLLRKGATRGDMQISVDGYQIIRELDKDGGNLRIETPDKALVKDPVEWLENKMGELGFDPLEFMRMKPEEQFAIIKGIVQLDVDIDDLEARNESDDETKNRIRATRRELKRKMAELQVVEDLPSETYDIPALMEELREADRFNRTIEDELRRRQTLESDLITHERTIRGLEDQLRQITNTIEQHRQLKAVMEKEKEAWKPLDKPKDRESIDTRIREASQKNNAIAANAAKKNQRDEMEKEISDIDKQEESLEEAVRARKLKIAETMQNAKFPIEGLSFETEAQGSGGRERKNPKKIVTYKGIPLTDASTAEQIRVSVSIGMATNPDLKLLLIREGSLIDENGMEILKEMARENGFQYILEVVDTTGKVGIYLEDGEVKAVNPEAEPAAEPAKATRSRRAK